MKTISQTEVMKTISIYQKKKPRQFLKAFELQSSITYRRKHFLVLLLKKNMTYDRLYRSRTAMKNWSLYPIY